MEGGLGAPASGRLQIYRAQAYVQWPVDCTSWGHFSIKKKKYLSLISCVSNKEAAIIQRWQKKQKPLLGSRVRGQKYAGKNPTS